MFDSHEKHLITRTQSGDPEAFSPLVTKYHDRLFAHILKRVTDPELAKYLTQETWRKVFRAIQTYWGESTFYSWL